jgi:Mn-dependent DtxR family transcriptional regulator
MPKGNTMQKLKTLENYLLSGQEATDNQIKKMFNISNPTAAIHSLRSKGICVLSRKTTLKDGREATKYRIGIPPAHMVKTLLMIGCFSKPTR